ncbi:MAG: DNA cytosine methyltransferase [FCB group bacterium]|jgi:DNA (cytosine-5)-methyltransferase 1|nr:DNA cytosine methyltransferase [FCB group bacterium]
MTDRPLGVDLFAGAGGLSLGFEQAGFDVAAAVELDPIHAAVHHFNFPQTAVLPKSVVGLRGDDLRAETGIGRRSVDVVFGGPPCQGFSLMGQRMLDDPRNLLVKEFVRLVVELKAKTFVFENVKGLTVGEHRAFLHALVKTFQDAGYQVRVPWRVLNAMHYGVPQDRQRLFLLGARKGGALPSYPEPTTIPRDCLPDGSSVRYTPTCAEALSDLPDVELYRELLKSDAVEVGEWAALTNYARECRCTTEESWHFGYPRLWQPNLLTSSARTVHTEISQRRFASTPEGEVEPISRFFKLHPDGLCNTLRAGTDSARGAFTSPRPIHYAYSRCITVREMARLHGYPDWFRFHVTKWHGARQVGNSVPPPMARAVAGAVLEALRIEAKRPSESVSLGDLDLLAMDMGEAARYWGVEVQIGRRDRKNGLRKRSQLEIEQAIRAGERENP